MDIIADYIVVGTGSAGAVVANRLSTDAGARVVALEAGSEDKDKFVHIPAAFPKLFRTAMDWDYLTEPQKELNARQIYWPRGKMLGGSSSMNAMLWARGFAADYEEWAALVSNEWSFDKAQQYFRRIENVTDAAESVDRGQSGLTGPLTISRQRSPRTWTAVWLAAVQDCGYAPARPNSRSPEGFCEAVVTQRKGARCSSADAYLRPAMKRDNLRVLTGATATRIIVEQGRAVGVEFERDGARIVANAQREVIVCGGAINSPQLLMLSGIGERQELEQNTIDVVRQSPEVGKNLQDHLLAVLGFDVAGGTLFDAEKPRELANYLLRRRGMLTSNVAEAYGFIRSQPDLELPDLELLFSPAAFFDEGLGEPYGHAVSLGCVLLKPKSRGQITLRSADPHAKPIIDPRYLSDPDGADRTAMMAGLRACATIAESPEWKGALGKIARPIGALRFDDDTLDEALRTCSHTIYHPIGTCRMGNDDASVVDPQLRVRGIAGLRVADASIMPTAIRGHPHAASVLIGEKASDLILSATVAE